MNSIHWLWSARMQLNSDYPTHHAFRYSHISNVESLHEATQKQISKHCNLITWKTNTYTPKHSNNYSLTRCVWPGKGAMQEEKQKHIKECKMTNTLHLTTHTYYTYTAWSVLFDIYYNPMNLFKTSMHLSFSYIPLPCSTHPTSWMPFTNYGKQECN